MIAVEATAGGQRVVLSGRWTLAATAPQAGQLASRLAAITRQPVAAWDLAGIEALDSAGAMLLWHAWQGRLPSGMALRPEFRTVFARLAAAAALPQMPAPPVLSWRRVRRLGAVTLGFGGHVRDLVALIGQVALDGLHCLRHPADIPWKETSATLYKAGVTAMPVAALVGLLIGIALSYLSALQLRQLGADVFIVNVLGLGIIRELGPMLVAVLIAGRSGSAMTAQLGVMRVTEEIDALAAMGVSRTLRLVLPKVVALALAMPALVLWTTAAALLGGMVAAQVQLDLAYGFFIESLPRAVPVVNLWIGLGKGVLFGILVALVACHFGLRVRPNTESLSANTTASVVAAITVVIVVDAMVAIATRSIGLPR